MLKQDNTGLRRTRYLWIYPSCNTPDKHREKYEENKKSDRLTGKAYSLKENIRELWNAKSMKDASKSWNSWYSWIIFSSVNLMKDVAGMMKL